MVKLCNQEIDIRASEIDDVVKSVTIVTVCLNCEETINLTLNSVHKQTYPYIDHVIIDGGSSDKTLAFINEYNPSYVISEPDEGIYCAMQKGAQVASGDIVFFLNSGDVFFNENIVEEVVKFFNLTGSDAVFGNLYPCYLNPEDIHDHKVFRPKQILDLSYFNNRKLFYEESIHHQTIFYKRKIFTDCGFICDKAAANGEYFLHMSAFISHSYTAKYIPLTICRFALGGKSTADFSLEWPRYVQAREILRGMFFPEGPDIPIENENEYLYYPPTFKIRFKIAFRYSKWYHHAIRFKQRLFKFSSLFNVRIQ